MLKHVQISPLRNRSDSISLRSTTSCASSICGSPEPPTELRRTPSRASSYSSLSDQLPQTTIKVFTNCLKIDIEYKTLGIQWDTTSKEVIAQLLRRLKVRHRDPRLFYISMEVSVRRAGVKTVLVLDDDTRPAILQACHPKGESRFCLQLKPGGLIRVHTSALHPTSQYKSLVISQETTSDELLQLLLASYNLGEPVEHFSIYEVCPGQEYQRKLHPDDIPLRAQAERLKRGESCHFLIRRNPNYSLRRQLLSSLDEVVQTYNPANKEFDADSTISSLEDGNSLLDVSLDRLSDDLHSLMTVSDEDEDCASSTSGSSDTSSEGSTTVRRTSSILSIVPLKSSATIKCNQQQLQRADAVCCKCRNNFKSCEFCNKNSTVMQLPQRPTSLALRTTTSTLSTASPSITPNMPPVPAYSPVYNIREIRTVSHSFSSLGNDKKLLDIQLNARFDAATCRLRPQTVYLARASRMIMDSNANLTQAATKQDANGNNALASSSIVGEMVNNHPAQGVGHFVYL